MDGKNSGGITEAAALYALRCKMAAMVCNRLRLPLNGSGGPRLEQRSKASAPRRSLVDESGRPAEK